MESDDLRAITAAELAWVRCVLDDMAEGRPTWSMEELIARAGEAP